MRPHMAHINNTLLKKKLAEDAADRATSYKRYMDKVKDAKALGFSVQAIIVGLEEEMEHIKQDERDGDGIFQFGLKNAKESCLNAISNIIEELKGEEHGSDITES